MCICLLFLGAAVTGLSPSPPSPPWALLFTSSCWNLLGLRGLLWAALVLFQNLQIIQMGFMGFPHRYPCFCWNKLSREEERFRDNKASAVGPCLRLLPPPPTLALWRASHEFSKSFLSLVLPGLAVFSEQNVPGPDTDPHGPWSPFVSFGEFYGPVPCTWGQAGILRALEFMPVGSSQRLVVGTPFEVDSQISRSVLLSKAVWTHSRPGHQNGADMLI